MGSCITSREGPLCLRGVPRSVQWTDHGRRWFNATTEQPRAWGVSVRTRKEGFQNIPEPPARPGASSTKVLISLVCMAMLGRQERLEVSGCGDLLRTDLVRPVRGSVTIKVHSLHTQSLRQRLPTRSHDTAQETSGNIWGTSCLSHQGIW